MDEFQEKIIERDIEEGKIKEELIEENIGYFKDKLKNYCN